MRNELPKLGRPDCEQRHVFKLLSDPTAQSGNAVERMHTPIVRNLLSCASRWKLKRAIKSNDLEYSAWEKRSAECRCQAEVNGGHSSLHAGVEALACPENGMSTDSPGESGFWQVKVRCFDSEVDLDRLDSAGLRTLETMDRLADTNVFARQFSSVRAPDDWIVVCANNGSEAVVASASREIEIQKHSFVDEMGDV